MTPGRELDALIAERVMGCLVRRRTDTIIEGSLERKEVRGSCLCDGRPHEVIQYASDGPHQCGLKRYSTDIAAAWSVVEKIKSIQPNPCLYGLPPDHPQEFQIQFYKKKWRVCWAPFNLDGNTTIEAEAFTAPHAICMAALKALEVPMK